MALMAPADDKFGDIQKSHVGEGEDYVALVKRHQKMVHALAFRMTGSLEDAEDLAQMDA